MPKAVSARLQKAQNRRGAQGAAHKILATLDRMYPNVTCALHHSNAWELLVATILSAQCTDKRVNVVTPGLFRKYPDDPGFRGGETGGTGAGHPLHRIFQQQGQVGDRGGAQDPERFRRRGAARHRQAAHGAGAARKTANVVLGTAFGIASGVVVDTHVQRIAKRLDLTKAHRSGQDRAGSDEGDPKEKWILFSHQIIHHGRALCVARNPKCAECGLNPLCYAKDKTA